MIVPALEELELEEEELEVPDALAPEEVAVDDSVGVAEAAG